MEKQKPKRVAIYGSTGSIGRQALDVIASSGGRFELAAIACGSSIGALEEQILRYRPERAAVVDKQKARELSERTRSPVLIQEGQDNAIKICAEDDVDIVINSTVGISGLRPTIEFIKAKKTVALANKESLVTGGSIVMPLARAMGVEIRPIDSEHSAIWQCLNGESNRSIEKLVITASGGPFRKREGCKYNDPADLRMATPVEASAHPTWNMGGRITIDSATLMNKGFEVIEACWLFGISPDGIQVLLHPKSIVHSAVCFNDGSMMAQMGLPDMRLPIQYALTYPERMESKWPRLDLAECGPIEFFRLDDDSRARYRCFYLAMDAFKTGGTAPAVLNGADEEAVSVFLRGECKFTDIADSVEHALASHNAAQNPCLKDILAADDEARKSVRRFLRVPDYSTKEPVYKGERHLLYREGYYRRKRRQRMDSAGTTPIDEPRGQV